MLPVLIHPAGKLVTWCRRLTFKICNFFPPIGSIFCSQINIIKLKRKKLQYFQYKWCWKIQHKSPTKRTTQYPQIHSFLWKQKPKQKELTVKFTVCSNIQEESNTSQEYSWSVKISSKFPCLHSASNILLLPESAEALQNTSARQIALNSILLAELLVVPPNLTR